MGMCKNCSEASTAAHTSLLAWPWQSWRSSQSRCSENAWRPWGQKAQGWAAYLPPSDGCIEVTKLPKNIGKVRAQWERYLDLWVLIRIVVGLVLVWEWEPLSQAVGLHASIGGLTCLLIVLLGILWWILRQLRGTIGQRVPVGGGLLAFFAWWAPFAPDFVFNMLAPKWLTLAGLEDLWNFKEPFFNMPIGAISIAVLGFACVASISWGARIGIRFLASAPDPDHEVLFMIGPDGRRIDVLPPTPFPQRCLGWTLWAIGMSLLLFSTHSDGVSFLVVIFALARGYLTHCWNVWWMMRDASQDCFTPQITDKMYEDQGQQRTAAEITKLQGFIRANPTFLSRFSDGAELRLRRFSDNGVHFRPPMENLTEEQRGRCVIL